VAASDHYWQLSNLAHSARAARLLSCSFRTCRVHCDVGFVALAGVDAVPVVTPQSRPWRGPAPAACLRSRPRTSPRVDHGLLSRYRDDDGLAGTEGAFVFCTFWLAHAQALAGEVDRARETFQRALHCGNDLGLLSEEFDSAAGEQLGNVPQAFSHIGLVNAAWVISQAERDVSARPEAVVV